MRVCVIRVFTSRVSEKMSVFAFSIIEFLVTAKEDARDLSRKIPHRTHYFVLVLRVYHNH